MLWPFALCNMAFSKKFWAFSFLCRKMSGRDISQAKRCWSPTVHKSLDKQTQPESQLFSLNKTSLFTTLFFFLSKIWIFLNFSLVFSYQIFQFNQKRDFCMFSAKKLDINWVSKLWDRDTLVLSILEPALTNHCDQGLKMFLLL